MREIVLAHIPKTAGTSLRNALERRFPRYRHIFDYGRHSPKTSQDVADLIYANQYLKGFRDALPNDEGILVSGHFGLKKYWRVFHPSSFIVFVRDPVSRVLSEYRHFVRNYGYDKSVDTFVENKRFQNVLFRHMQVELDRVGFIGAMEKFDDSLAVLSKRIGRTIKPRHDNVGGGTATEELASDDALTAKIRRINHEDIDLYRYLIDELIPQNWARNDEQINPSRVSGFVEQHGAEGLRGIAFDLAQTALLDVSVSAGGKRLLTVTADLYEPDLKTRNRVISGVGGFQVSIKQLRRAGLKPAKGVPLTVTAAGRELHGSPVTIE